MKRISYTFLLFGFLMLIAPMTALAQTGEDTPVKAPDAAMAQVVSRILTWHFKPRSKPKTIYLYSEGVKKEWLPEIKNIEFRLVPYEETKQIGEMFWFDERQFSNGKYSIFFGYGNPICSDSLGATWSFRVFKQRVRLWREDGQTIHSCNY